MPHPAKEFMDELMKKKMMIMLNLGMSEDKITAECIRYRDTIIRIKSQDVSPPSGAELKIMVPLDLYDAVMKEVMDMPVKKRKQFTSFLIDKKGEKTKVIYEDGMLKNWSTISHCYAEIVPDNYIPEEEKICMTNFGRYNALNNEMKFMSAEQFLNWWVVNITHTGNHTGRVNHRIKVPTAAGQPCRS